MVHNLEAPLIDRDIAYRFYFGDEAESPAITTIQTILDLAQKQPHLYQSLEVRFDRIQDQEKPWADTYLSTALTTFRVLDLSAEVWEKIPPLITPDIIEEYQNLIRLILINMKLENLLPVIKVNGGENLIFLVCADAQRPTIAEIFGITDVFLPWQAALNSRKGSP